ncbi:MAG: hypothetical protein ACK5CA_08535 [Cyanobacteriota bacterium]
MRYSSLSQALVHFGLEWADSFGAGAIVLSGGTANIVSSIVSNSGGFQFTDNTLPGTLNFVNSILLLDGGGETLASTSRIFAGDGGEANITASTILYNSIYTSSRSIPFNETGTPLTASISGSLNLNSSVVSVLNWDTFNPGENSYAELSGGNLTADGFSFITPTASQDRAIILALFNNAGILTEGVPLPITNLSGADLFQALPLGATPVPNGPLVGVVPNAGVGGVNALINPINGQQITTDVFGNPRINAAGFRDIGAVAATPVPLESDALPVVGATLFMAGGIWWKRKRQQTKVSEFT